ncbi:MAG: ribose 5-phosphate isomerase B [Alphaproteobacteria bacterium]|nr:MAG: ribose 5-phosphate isomerase B [Alphaproteobacteria bacterium]
MTANKSIAIGSDHAGFDMKEALKAELTGLGYHVEDFGTNSIDSVDYPDFATPVAKAVNAGQFKTGLLICGSGQGMAITANKLPHVRAALCRNTWDADMARKHNDANILCLGGRVTGVEEAKLIMRDFLNTEFEGGRHASRVNKMAIGC